MTTKTVLLATSLMVAPVLAAAQGVGTSPGTPTVVPGPAVNVAGQQGGLDPKDLYKPLQDSWPTYSGDYTGQRYSRLTQVNQTTVKNLTLAWVGRVSAGAGSSGGNQTIVGGEGTLDFGNGGTPSVKGVVLQVDGTLYVTAPDNVWALDARDGRELWHYFWKTKGGTHIGSRGAGIWHNYLFFETPDNYLVSLDARTGQERWHVEISDFKQQYFSTDRTGKYTAKLNKTGMAK